MKADTATALRSPAHRVVAWFVRYRNALVVIAIASVMLAGFAASYSLALGRPTPSHVPVGVVGSSPQQVQHLQLESGSRLSVTRYPDRAAALHAIDEQEIYGALLPERRPPQVIVSSASGTSVSRLLETAAQQDGQQVVDAHPLSSNDPQGLIIFYVALAATILGFVAMFQLRANQAAMGIGGWVACVAGLAVLGGLFLAVVTDSLLDAITAPFPELWAVLAAQIGITGLFNCLMLTLIGRWAILPTWTLFVLLGNASSGGAVAPPLLPTFYRIAGEVIPTGAVVEQIRTGVYFRSAQHLGPLLVLGAWLLGTLAVLLAVSRWKGRTPNS